MPRMGLFRRSRTQPTATASAQIVPLNDSEQHWIEEHLQQLHASGVNIEDPTNLGRHYDVLLTHWLSTPQDLRPDPNADINLIGIGLGEYLHQWTGLSWVVAADAGSTEIALHGQPGDVLIYPTNAVAKRWVARETGFLPGFAAEILDAVAQIRPNSAQG